MRGMLAQLFFQLHRTMLDFGIARGGTRWTAIPTVHHSWRVVTLAAREYEARP